MSLLTSAIKTDLYRFFSIAFNAAPGVTYMNQLAEAVEAGMSVKQIVNVFTAKSEFTSTYPSFYTAEQFANKLVNTVVGSAATDAAKTQAKADIVAGLNSGMSRGDVVYQIFTNLANKAADDADWGATATQMANKVAVAQYYTEDLLTDTTNLTTLRNVIANVTATTDVSTDAAKQAVLDVAVPVEAQTFTLTTAADVKSLGAGADTFYGSMTTAGDTDTLTAGDDLNGLGGTDTLTVTVSGAGTGAALSQSPTLTGVEKVLVRNSLSASTSSAAVDLSLADSSVANVGTVASSTDDVLTSFTNVSQLVGVEMKGAGDLTVSFVGAAVSGTGDALTLTLNGVGTASGTGSKFDSNGIETLNVVSSSAANYLDLGTGIDGGLTTVNVSGSKALTIDLGTNTVKTVNASAATAAVTVTGFDTSTVVTVTGGSANDSFDFTSGFDASTGATAKDVINGGDGVDTLKIAAGTGVADALFGNVTNIETLTLSTATGTTTLSTVADAAGIVTVNMSAGSGDLTIGTGYAGEITVNLSSTASDDTVTNSSTGASVTVKAAAAKITNADVFAGGTGTTETMTLSADDNSTGAVFGTGFTNFDNITVAAGTGTGNVWDISITTDDANVGSGKTMVVDASALTSSSAVLTFVGSAEADGKFSVTGGAGNDSITLGTGATNDTVSGGDGKDTIVGGQGNDSLSGGAGNDTFQLANNLSSGDTIDGGDGTDTLEVGTGALTSAMFTNVTNVENLVFSGNATLSSNIPFSTFDLSASTGANALTFGSGYTSESTVTLGSGDSVTNSANAAVTVNATMAALADSDSTGADAAATFTGGTGTDTLNITVSFDGNAAGTYGTGTGNDIYLAIASGASINTINVLDGTGAGYDAYITLDSGYGVSVTVDASTLDGATGTGDEKLVFGASGLTAAKTANVTGGAGADSITGGSGNDTLVGGDGNDTVVGFVGGSDNISGGNGNDTISMGGVLTGDDIISGGDGNDTLSISQTTVGAIDLDFLQVTGIETLQLGTGNGLVTLDVRAAAAGINKVILGGDTNKLTVSGYTTAFTVDATVGATGASIVGGRGDDTFKFDGTDGIGASTTLSGGAGTDTISLNNSTGAGTAVSVTLASGVTGVEIISADDTSTGTGGDVSITLNASFGGTGQTSLSVDMSALDAGETLSFTNSSTGDVNATTTGTQYISLTITGGAGADTITGGAGAQTISGGSGDDVITGGNGADNITGGAGNDVFVYTYGATGESTSAVTDTITDFASGDAVRFDLSLTAAGTYDLNSKGAAASTTDGLTLLSGVKGQYFYNSTNAQLVMDTDGNGLIQSTDTIITLSGTTGLSESDVKFVISQTAAGASGANTVTLGDSVDTIEFYDLGTGTANIAYSTGDVFTDFNAGSGGDVIKLDQFGTGGTFGTYTLGSTGAAFVGTGANNFVVAYGTGAGDTLGTSDLGTGAGKLNLAINEADHFVLFADSGTGDTALELYYINAEMDGTGGAIAAADIRLIGTINLISGDTASSLNSTNFDLS